MRLSQYRISQRIQINPVHCQRSLLLSNTFYQPSIRVMLHEFLSCKIICTEYFLRNLKSRLLRLHYNFCIRTVMAVGLRIYVTQVQKCEKKNSFDSSLGFLFGHLLQKSCGLTYDLPRLLDFFIFN